jgi:hypothetical protein
MSPVPTAVDPLHGLDGGIWFAPQFDPTTQSIMIPISSSRERRFLHLAASAAADRGAR